MRSLWLIGFRGSGKTTLGRRIAHEQSVKFLDLDEEWERAKGETIVAFAERKGITAFREEEKALLESTAERMLREPLVVATGGGFVDWEPSRELLSRSTAPKVYLRVPAEALWERLRGCEDRLKIGGLSDLEALRKLLEKRLPFYEKIASYTLDNYDIEVSLTALKSCGENL